MHFVDRVYDRIRKNNSVLVAGFDPRPDSIPTIFHDIALKNSQTNEEYIYKLLTEFHGFCLSHIHEHVAAVKPNLAFFEALGIPGIRAFYRFCDEAQSFQIPVIADAKRGDIGSTAAAYSNAFLGRSSLKNKQFPVFNADALTVSPFLGFDTLEPFLKDCKEYEKGIFVLVKTSNPGSASIQNRTTESGLTVSEEIANWVAEQAEAYTGECGYSSIGAVVGATYPAEAIALRERMPRALFLIPGLGAQGGTAEDAVAGFGPDKHGGLINVSRGLLSSFSKSDLTREAIIDELQTKLSGFNNDVNAALV